MKKIYLLLLLAFPFISMAQNFYDPLNYLVRPEILGTVDTFMFYSGDYTYDEYSFNRSEDSTYKYKNIVSVNADNKVLFEKFIFIDQSILEYRLWSFTYKNGLLIEYNNSSKQTAKPNISLTKRDSFQYDQNSASKYTYHFDKDNILFGVREYIHDLTNGLTTTQIIQSLPTRTFGNLVDVIEFHKPKKPKVIHVFDYKNETRTLSKVLYYTYDNLDRLTYFVDSSIVNGVLKLNSIQKQYYRGNSNQLDSINVESFTSNLQKEAFKFHYGTNNKLKYYNYYTTYANDPYYLAARRVYNSGISGLNNFGMEKIQLTLYPNPTNSKIYIDTKENLEQIQVFDTKGQLLLNKQEKGIDQIDMSELPPGVYIINAKSEKGIAHSRILKTN